MNNLKITQQDIADALGLSRSTVSKAFNGQPLPDRVRDEVLKKARELGYLATAEGAPDAAAAAREVKPGGLFLLICFQAETGDSAGDVHGPLTGRWQKLINGMERACVENRYHLIVTIITGLNKVANRLVDQYTLSKADGVILCGNVTAIKEFLAMNRRQTPMVVADASDIRYFEMTDLDVIVHDIIGATYSFVRHLILAGHRHIGFVGSLPRNDTPDERLMGISHACRVYGIQLDKSFLFPMESDQWQEQFLQRLQSQEPLPTAFLCESDVIALEVRSMLLQQGLHVPGEMCVVGFDNVHESSRNDGVATTLFHREELGYQAVSLLLDRIRKPDAPTRMIRQRVELVYVCPRCLAAANTAAQHAKQSDPFC